MRRSALAIAAAVLLLASCSQPKLSMARRALIYGVSLYQSGSEGSSPNLTYADDDAASLATTLSQKGWSEVTLRASGTGRTTSILPTKAAILSDIAALAAASSPDDMVFMYFSGHGTSVDGVSYLVPYGGLDLSKDSRIDEASCITPAELSAALASLPTNKVIVVLDNCYSGGFVDAGSDLDTAPQNYGPKDEGVARATIGAAFSNFGGLLAKNAAARGVALPIVISAAGATELSYEDATFGHGIFTYFLLESATGKGDANGDGFVTTSEAYAYAVEGVRTEWNANNWDYYDWNSDTYADYMCHISGGARDLVLFEL